MRSSLARAAAPDPGAAGPASATTRGAEGTPRARAPGAPSRRGRIAWKILAAAIAIAAYGALLTALLRAIDLLAP